MKLHRYRTNEDLSAAGETEVTISEDGECENRTQRGRDNTRLGRAPAAKLS